MSLQKQTTFLFCEKCHLLKKIQGDLHVIPYKEFQEFVKHDNCLENYRENIASAHHTIFYTVWEK